VPVFKASLPADFDAQVTSLKDERNELRTQFKTGELELDRGQVIRSRSLRVGSLPQDTPEPEPTDEAPPGDQLGLDAEGVAGGDAFGLAARKGGSDIIGGGGGAAFAFYTGMLKDGILDALSDDERVRKGNYKLTVRIWVAPDGRVERIVLVDSTGNAELDAAVEQALGRMNRVREAPPIEMPQPVTLRIVSRS
jgi:protein TonB